MGTITDKTRSDLTTGDRKPSPAAHTPGPWDYIASTDHHGPYVTGPFGGDICDCYVMSNPSALSMRNGGDSKPIHFQHEAADANARLIAAAPALFDALKSIMDAMPRSQDRGSMMSIGQWHAARRALSLAKGVE